MPEHELWLTALFNDQLAGLANSILSLSKLTAKYMAARPWANWMVMEILVVAILMLLFAVLRPRLSAENPGKLQHVFELIWSFINNTASEVGIHHPAKYASYFGTVFIFILFMNLIGIIPGFESPTMYGQVPFGLAICTFSYYNTMGLRELGLWKYLAQLAGPVWWLAWLMIPIEVISHLARPLSLSFRLFGNMYAGEQVTGVFLSLTYLVMPAVFMGLHVFVALLQTYVFTLLTMIYVSLATSHEH
jgi:F-type H+-transporting ATPase subunit a